MVRAFVKYLLAGLLLFCVTHINAQLNADIFNERDTLFKKPPLVDSTFLNRDIFEMLLTNEYNQGNITINQSHKIEVAMRNIIAGAFQRKLNGYRIRIYFDNKQDSRAKSESIKNSFLNLFPETEAYRTYDNPYFKVTVGDFRTRSDAMKFLRRVETLYPSAFIVREAINFPPL